MRGRYFKNNTVTAKQAQQRARLHSYFANEEWASHTSAQSDHAVSPGPRAPGRVELAVPQSVPQVHREPQSRPDHHADDGHHLQPCDEVHVDPDAQAGDPGDQRSSAEVTSYDSVTIQTCENGARRCGQGISILAANVIILLRHRRRQIQYHPRSLALPGTPSCDPPHAPACPAPPHPRPHPHPLPPPPNPFVHAPAIPPCPPQPLGSPHPVTQPVPPRHPRSPSPTPPRHASREVARSYPCPGPMATCPPHPRPLPPPPAHREPPTPMPAVAPAACPIGSVSEHWAPWQRRQRRQWRGTPRLPGSGE